MSFNIWANFPKYWIYCTEENFELKIKDLILNQKNFFAFMYGKHDMWGQSWCSDCDIAEPFVNNVKPLIAKNEEIKEIYFVNIPIAKDKKKLYKDNKTLKFHHVPTLIYFQRGKEIRRMTENQMFSQFQVTSFVEKAYEDVNMIK
jgi:thiol-disulfide isomerase/thioredoxin